ESGGLEVCDCGVENGEREVRLEEAQDGVRFEDGVFGVGDELADAGHGLGELTLAGADPEDSAGAGGEEARGVGTGSGVALFGDGEGVVWRLAVAGLAVGGADVVAELRDLDGGPVELRQSGDDAGNDRGLAD